ncbi:hypothetical protein [uncultured Tateyamaria sp.]|uniref:hypothetical protein n=1 Tax=uncultured Tateyamaria sp. TaxID=455651 RepID=UPI00261E109C|nr:hypothetical protein [uncultured Tateyamaria sp.]
MSRNSMDTARADADGHREGLTLALNALLSNRAPEAAGHAATTQLADLARLVTRRARANPLSVAVVGAGIAMFALPQRPAPSPEPQPTSSAPLSGEANKRIARAAARHKQQARVQADNVDVGPGRAQALRIKLDAGLDRLSPDARAKVRTARLNAIAAQEKLERHSAKLAAAAQKTHQERPIVTTLVAAGIGALIGAALPGTRREAEVLGAKRDQLLRDAEAVLRDEIATLEARSKSAIDSGMAAARDALDNQGNGRGATHG